MHDWKNGGRRPLPLQEILSHPQVCTEDIVFPVLFPFDTQVRAKCRAHSNGRMWSFPLTSMGKDKACDSRTAGQVLKQERLRPREKP